MKTIIFLLLISFVSVLAKAQGSFINPELSIQFNDEILMHNMHITFDGSYYYTVNGGTASKGAINKYSTNGSLIGSYKLYLDMRSIFFNPQDNGLYVSTNDNKICKITNLNTGNYETKYSNLYENGQACLGLSTDGKYLYYLDKDVLKKFDFRNGSLVNTYTGLKSGANSNFIVAVDESNIYTFDSDMQEVYIYDLNANYIKTIKIPTGNFRFSLSIANGLLFTSYDGNSGTGTWYGYKIKNKNGNNNQNTNNRQTQGGTLELTLQFEDNLARHNMHLTSDGSSIYTVNGGGINGEINRYNLKGEFIKKYKIALDMRTIFFNPQDGSLYLTALDHGIYKIDNLETGQISLKFSNLYDNGQAVLASSADGNYIFHFSSGTLQKFDLNSGSLLQTYNSLKFGAKSANTVAVDYEFIYTFDSENKTVFVYDLEANFVKTIQIPEGDFSFSLSTGMDLLWVAKDGNYATGTWYGYKVH